MCLQCGPEISLGLAASRLVSDLKERRAPKEPGTARECAGREFWEETPKVGVPLRASDTPVAQRETE